MSWQVYKEHFSLISKLFSEGNIKVPQLTNLGLMSSEAVCKAHHLMEDGKVKGKFVMIVD